MKRTTIGLVVAVGGVLSALFWACAHEKAEQARDEERAVTNRLPAVTMEQKFATNLRPVRKLVVVEVDVKSNVLRRTTWFGSTGQKFTNDEMVASTSVLTTNLVVDEEAWKSSAGVTRQINQVPLARNAKLTP